MGRSVLCNFHLFTLVSIVLVLTQCASGYEETVPEVEKPATDIQRTIVFIQKQTQYGDNVFLRGGCGEGCNVTITYPPPKSGDGFAAYNAWSAGDKALDWYGPEEGQGKYNNISAEGSPMVWTTSDLSGNNYVPENTYGDHYWMWDVMMDCSKTQEGYFEVKGYLNGQWESDIPQTTCYGQPSPAHQSINHVARCGYKNVFTWSASTCRMEGM